MAGAALGVTIDTDSEAIRLLERRRERPPFLHPAWLQVWFSEFASDQEPVTVRAPGGRGFGSFFRTDDRLSFWGDRGVCDYMDFALPDDATDDDYQAVWSALRAEDWSELELWGLAAHSPTRAQIERLAAEAAYDFTTVEEDVAPRVVLPDSWAGYLATLTKKDRHELRRKMNRLTTSGKTASLRILSAQRDVGAAMDAFFRLHRVSRAEKAEFMTPAMEAFFRRMTSVMAGHGLVRLFMFDLDGEPAASVLCLDAGSFLYMYNSGYSPEFASLSVGLISKALCLRWAIENGKEGLDFLRGNEPYKYDLGATSRPVYRLTVRR